jgi:hypothetical protein
MEPVSTIAHLETKGFQDTVSQLEAHSTQRCTREYAEFQPHASALVEQYIARKPKHSKAVSETSKMNWTRPPLPSWLS